MSELQHVRYDSLRSNLNHSGADFRKGYKWIGVRHSQAVVLFFGLCIAFALRVNLSVGIVAMVDSAANPPSQSVDWSIAERGTILGSFFWGYVVTQVPAGLISARIGASKPLGITMIINGISTVLFPVVALRGGFLPACFIRVIQGLGQGFLYPSCNTLMSKWAVPAERGRIYAFIFGGAQFGTIVMLAAGGFIAANAGWQYIFYGSGALGIIWGIICLWFVVDSPEKHKSISKEERSFIEASLISTADSTVRLKTPWSKMACSVPLWALMLAHMANNWGFWSLLTLMPSFISGVLHFDIKQNGFLSALPYLVMWIASLIFSVIADYLIKKEIFTPGVSRKFWNSVALYGGAVALGLLSFINTDAIGAIALLTVSVGLNAGTYSGYYLNHLDLSPNFAGTLMGITNCIANICSLIGPTLAGVIVTEEGNAAQWRIVFLITAALFVIGETIFNIFGSSDVQSWNNIHFDVPNETKEETGQEKVNRLP